MWKELLSFHRQTKIPAVSRTPINEKDQNLHLLLDFPGGLVAKNQSTCQCMGHRFNPWCMKIPHAEGQLNLGATTAEPML